MREVTIKIEDEVYEYFKDLAEERNELVEDLIAAAAWFYYALMGEGETQKENGVTAHHDR